MSRLSKNALTCRDKRRFGSGKAARRSLAKIRTVGERREHKPSRAYHCPECDGWHLTAQGQGT